MNAPADGDRRAGPLRERKVARTEASIIKAATNLFVNDGYVATALAAVAEAADVAPRTVYVRFGSKATLLKRVLDVAAAGDNEPVAVIDREPSQAAMTAPTRAERIAALATLVRDMMERLGPLIAVAEQAAADEPLIAEHIDTAQRETREFHRLMWTRMRDEGLLEPGARLDWIIDTAAVIAAPETYQLCVQMFGWKPDAYEQWLRETLTVLTA